MNVKAEQEKRIGIASELADIEMRQRAIVQWNGQISTLIPEDQGKEWNTMVEEDNKNLRMIETVMTSFGVRVDPKPFAQTLTDHVSQRLQDPGASLVEKMGAYALVKQAQVMCGHLVHKCAQEALPDVKEALLLFEGVQSTLEKQVAQVAAMVEKVGVESIMGQEPAGGVGGRLRDVAATAAGVVLGKVGKPADEMSILNVLRMDHMKVRTLFREIEQATNPVNRSDLFYQLRADLQAHAEAEEQTFYRIFARTPELQDFFDESRIEHEQMRVAIDQVNNLDPSSQDFTARLKYLKDIVEHHVDEEENEGFPLVEAQSNDAELQKVAAEFIQVKAHYQNQHSPYRLQSQVVMPGQGLGMSSGPTVSAP